ncbi:MAG TPA: PAS domain-containing protein, partial [Alphaproteobacteria bacterium]|nr:PAS domain-containing protein [Alphaproteobacteria bacterium]
MFESGIAEAGGSEPLLRLVLASMPYGLSIWNEKRRLVLCNQACLDMYRYGDVVRSGMSLYELCELTVALGNHPDMTVDELFRLYGEQFDACDDPARPLRTQKAIRGRFIRTTQVRAPGIGWIITHEDVTEPVEQQWMAELREKTLAEQNLRFNAALAHMAHGLSMYDAERRLVICNERYRQIYGLPAELCRPGTAYDAFLRFRDEHGVVPVDGADASVEHVLGASRGDQPRAEAFRLPDGRVITLTCSPMSNGGFLVTHQDVTLEVLFQYQKSGRDYIVREVVDEEGWKQIRDT